MSGQKNPRSKGMRSGHGRKLTELRRSNAAGLHIKQSRDRANTEREAIEQSLADE